MYIYAFVTKTTQPPLSLDKYFSFCHPEFEAEIFSANCVIFDKSWSTMQCCQTHILTQNYGMGYRKTQNAENTKV